MRKVLLIFAFSIVTSFARRVQKIDVPVQKSPIINNKLIGFPNLHARHFRHPQDKPLLLPAQLAIRMVLQVHEDIAFQNLVGSSVKVSSAQYSMIHRLVLEAAAQLDMVAPDVFVQQDPDPNAYTLAFKGKRPFIVLHSSLIDLLTLEELKAVIGHELGHLKCEHGLSITALNILDIIETCNPEIIGSIAKGLLFIVKGFAMMFNSHIAGILVSLAQLVIKLINLSMSICGPFISSRLAAWRRGAELSCDRAMLLVAQDEEVVMSALMKITGGTLSLSKDMSAKEFAHQVKNYDEVAKSSCIGKINRWLHKQEPYPLPILRAREIQRYARSKPYKMLKASRATKVQV